jgi:hypothetical protein
MIHDALMPCDLSRSFQPIVSSWTRLISVSGCYILALFSVDIIYDYFNLLNNDRPRIFMLVVLLISDKIVVAIYSTRREVTKEGIRECVAGNAMIRRVEDTQVNESKLLRRVRICNKIPNLRSRIHKNLAPRFFGK